MIIFLTRCGRYINITDSMVFACYTNRIKKKKMTNTNRIAKKMTTKTKAYYQTIDRNLFRANRLKKHQQNHIKYIYKQLMYTQICIHAL